MAYSDKAGRVKKAGKTWMEDLRVLREEVKVKVDHATNLVVGDFITELLTVMRTKISTGLRDGDWIEDPERIYTDGGIFGEETRVATDVKLQVAVCIDVSKSTYFNGVAAVMGKAVLALNKMMSKAQADLPEGALKFRIFAFNRNVYPITNDNIINLDTSAPAKRSETDSDSTLHQWGTYYIRRSDTGAKEEGLSLEQVTAKAQAFNRLGIRWKYGYDNNWSETLVTPLFEAIEAWEQAEGDPTAYRIDIILSDGEWDNHADVVAASKVQERRNGQLTTFMLNFLPRKDWGKHALPHRCYMYEANREYLGQQIQQIVSDSLLELA